MVYINKFVVRARQLDSVAQLIRALHRGLDLPTSRSRIAGGEDLERTLRKSTRGPTRCIFRNCSWLDLNNCIKIYTRKFPSTKSFNIVQSSEILKNPDVLPSLNSLPLANYVGRKDCIVICFINSQLELIRDLSISLSRSRQTKMRVRENGPFPLYN